MTAATVSRALTVRDGAAVTCRRALLHSDLDSGAMALLQLGEDAAQAAVDGVDGQITVGAANSLFSSVVAGDDAAVEKVLADVSARGVFCRRIAVDYASHSAPVEPVLAPLRACLADLRPRPCAVPIHSTLLDQIIDGRQPAPARPVRLAVRVAFDDERPTLFVEMSPHPTMVGSIEDETDLAGTAGGAVGSLHRDEPWTVLPRAAGIAYGHGCDLRWERVNPPDNGSRCRPTPWQRERYWPEPAPPATTPAPAAAPAAAEVPVPTAVDAATYARDLPAGAGGPLPAVMDGVAALAPGREVVLEDVREGPWPDGATLRLEVVAADEGWRFTVRHGAAGPGGFTCWTPVAAGSCRAAAATGSPASATGARPDLAAAPVATPQLAPRSTVPGAPDGARVAEQLAGAVAQVLQMPRDRSTSTPRWAGSAWTPCWPPRC